VFVVARSKALAHGRPHRERVVQHGHLWQVRRAPPGPPRDAAAVGGECAGQDLEQGRLSGAVRPDEPDAIAIGDGEAHGFEEGAGPEAVAKLERGQQDRH
jgi:hypothetical protein